MSSVVRAIVAGHGGFPDGVISAVDQITGRGEVFVGVSNRDLCGSDLERALREHVEAGVRTIFTDLPGGSATLAARRLLRDVPDLVVVTGTSVAVLLDFLFNADAIDAAPKAVEKGRQALAVYGVVRAD